MQNSGRNIVQLLVKSLEADLHRLPLIERIGKFKVNA